MARGTKSSKGSGKKAESSNEATEPQDSTDQFIQAESESPDPQDDTTPVVIEGEVVEPATDDRIAAAAIETRNAMPMDGEDAVPTETKPETTPEPDPVIAAPVAPPPPPAASGGSFMGTVLGGVIAAAIGFGLATYGAPRGWLSFAGVGANEGASEAANFASTDDVTAQAGRIDGLESTISDLSDSIDGLATASPEPVAAPEVDLSPLEGRLDTLAADIEALRNMPAQILETEAGEIDLTPIQTALSDLGTRLDGVDENLSGLADSLSGLDQRLVALEEAASSTEGSDAMAEQLAAFRQEMDEVAADARSKIDEAQERAAEIEAAAAEAEARAAQAAALAQVTAALDSGAGFADLLPTLDAVPDVLAANAEEGIATLSELQRTFPSVARAALSVSQSVPQDADSGSRLVAFLKKQTNARSLTPREGDGADAVLSRAEAALGSGDLAAAMTELSALSEDAQAAMSDWLMLAEERIAAVDAVSALSDELN